MISIELALGIIGTAIAVLSIYLSRKDQIIDTVKKQENRLTKLEQFQFTQEDRQCLYELKMKMDLWWSIVEKEFPKLLIQKETPKLDILLEKASLFGVGYLKDKEKQDLATMLDDEYHTAIKNEDSGRAMAIALYRAVVKYKAEGDMC